MISTRSFILHHMAESQPRRDQIGRAIPLNSGPKWRNLLFTYVKAEALMPISWCVGSVGKLKHVHFEEKIPFCHAVMRNSFSMLHDKTQ